MQSQRDKQQCQRDLENKDDEMEEMRSDYQKKVCRLDIYDAKTQIVQTSIKYWVTDIQTLCIDFL